MIPTPSTSSIWDLRVWIWDFSFAPQSKNLSPISSAELERRSSKPQVVSSNLTSATNYLQTNFSRLAQLEERLSYKQKVKGSNPLSATNFNADYRF